MNNQFSWYKFALVGVCGALIVNACKVGSSSDDDNIDIGAGASAGTTHKGGGSNTAGTAGTEQSAGGATPTAGSGGTETGGSSAGTGGAETFDCSKDTGNKPTTCDNVGDKIKDADCAKCVQTHCCDEWKACDATGPANACAFAGIN